MERKVYLSKSSRGNLVGQSQAPACGEYTIVSDSVEALRAIHNYENSQNVKRFARDFCGLAIVITITVAAGIL